MDSLFYNVKSIGNLSTNDFERRHQPNMEYAFLSTGFVQIFGQFVSQDANLVASTSHIKRKKVSSPVVVCLVKCLCLNSLIVSLHVM